MSREERYQDREPNEQRHLSGRPGRHESPYSDGDSRQRGRGDGRYSDGRYSADRYSDDRETGYYGQGGRQQFEDGFDSYTTSRGPRGSDGYGEQGMGGGYGGRQEMGGTYGGARSGAGSQSPSMHDREVNGWGGMSPGSQADGIRGNRSGMQGQYSGKGPKGWSRSDDRLKEDVSEALARHPELDASEIEVECSNGEITLTGTVSDRAAKRMAEDAVEQVFGVNDVHNSIRVQREQNGNDSSAQRAESGSGMSAKSGGRSGSGRSGGQQS